MAYLRANIYVKTEFIHTVIGHGAKTAKIIKKHY